MYVLRKTIRAFKHGAASLIQSRKLTVAENKLKSGAKQIQFIFEGLCRKNIEQVRVKSVTNPLCIVSDGRKTWRVETMASLSASGLWGIGKRSISCPKIPSFQFKSPSLGAGSRARSRSVCQTQRWAVKASANGSGSPSPGLYSAKLFDLTPQNVDMVLEDVRPYLITDGGNVDVVSVDDGVISLKLQGILFLGFAYSFMFLYSD